MTHQAIRVSSLFLLLEAFEFEGKTCALTKKAWSFCRREELILWDSLPFGDSKLFVEGAWVLDGTSDPIVSHGV